MNYPDYGQLLNDIAETERYGWRAYRMGRTAEGRVIFAVLVGSGESPALICGGTHAMEGASVYTVSRLMKEAARGVVNSKSVLNALMKRGALFIPMLNPDGYERVKEHPGEFWQANARGVDINHNFPFKFKKQKALLPKGPCASKYPGRYPFSEGETRAARDTVRLFSPRSLYCFHTQGREIYWQANGSGGDRAAANHYAKLTGYRLADTEGSASYGGFKDWFIDRFRRPGFTIELGEGKNPLPTEDYEDIYAEVAPMLSEIFVN